MCIHLSKLSIYRSKTQEPSGNVMKLHVTHGAAHVAVLSSAVPTCGYIGAGVFIGSQTWDPPSNAVIRKFCPELNGMVPSRD